MLLKWEVEDTSTSELLLHVFECLLFGLGLLLDDFWDLRWSVGFDCFGVGDVDSFEEGVFLLVEFSSFSLEEEFAGGGFGIEDTVS